MGLLAKTMTDIYSDVDSKMVIHPVSKDTSRLIDEEAIKISMKNLLLTNKGERLFKPTLGSNIRKMLFENITPDVMVILREYVISTLETYEPRINILGVDVTSALDSNAVNIIITFNIQKSETPVTLSLIINRVR